jgi:hypothetical protein
MLGAVSRAATYHTAGPGPCGCGPGVSPPTSKGEPVLRIFPHPGRPQISYGSRSMLSFVCHSCRPIMQRGSFMATSRTAMSSTHPRAPGSCRANHIGVPLHRANREQRRHH